MKIKPVTTEPDLNIIKKLFLEYQKSIKIDLSFQDFYEELNLLPGKYASPSGRLYLGMINKKTAGYIALRPFDKNQCEMNRLYIHKKCWGQGIS